MAPARKPPDSAASRHFYRLVRAEYASAPFSGTGAEKWGGRWNSPGVKAVYCSDSKALAVLEILVHAGQQVLSLSEYRMFTLTVPETLIVALDRRILPADWQKYQEQEQTQALGDAFLDPVNQQPLLLTVPSTLTGEDNALFNPEHPDAAAVLAAALSEPFRFDRRLSA